MTKAPRFWPAIVGYFCGIFVGSMGVGMMIVQGSTRHGRLTPGGIVYLCGLSLCVLSWIVVIAHNHGWHRAQRDKS